MTATWLDDDGETTLWECNDCGRLIPLIPMYNELCISCQRKEDQEEYDRMLDPYGYYSNPGAF